jgi:hypothetical protein
MRLRLFILVICAFAVLAAPARADHGVTVVDSTLARYMQIAAAYWNAPEPVCTGQNGEVIHPHAVMADDPTPGVAAWAEVGGCHIWLDRDFWPSQPDEQHCNLIAHEWGHLLGHVHSTDPNDLMWPQWTNNVVPGCRVFAAPAAPPAVPAPIAPATVKVHRLTKLQRAQRAKRAKAKRACAARRHRGRRAYRLWLRRHPRRARQLGCVGQQSKSKKHRRAGAAASATRRWHGRQLEPGVFSPFAADDHTSFSLLLTVAALR